MLKKIGVNFSEQGYKSSRSVNLRKTSDPPRNCETF